LSEFALIGILRARCAHGRGDVTLGIGDDAALLDVPAGRRLVVCTDSMVEGVHFLRGTDPADLGWKALAVNLSDLAAMGAEPAWALLALSLPAADAGFVERFADGFAELARLHRVALVGGDTTQGPLAITITALGFVAPDAALTRAGARVGDAVYVTGTLGDAAAALELSLPPPAGTAAIHGQELRGAEGGWGRLSQRLRRPQPRVAAGMALRGLASACIDVSDGLLADLGHMCEASGVGAELAADALPLSAPLRAAFGADACRNFALTGGDDYELCFAAPPAAAANVETAFAKLGLGVTRIGRIVAGSRVRALDAGGRVIEPPHAGWEHFAR
jgi:thiamine-monophosphate kinase